MKKINIRCENTKHQQNGVKKERKQIHICCDFVPFIFYLTTHSQLLGRFFSKSPNYVQLNKLIRSRKRKNERKEGNKIANHFQKYLTNTKPTSVKLLIYHGCFSFSLLRTLR